jgi:tetratricopeptide (TPR) repeat protein
MVPFSINKLAVLLFLLTGADGAQAWQVPEAQPATLGNRAVAEDQVGAVHNTNNSVFARAVAASTKRDKALSHWQAFQKTDEETDLRNSLEYLAGAIALAPESKATWQLASRIQYGLKAIPAFKLEAIKSFEKLLQLDPEDLSSRVLLIDELISLHAWQRAAKHMELMFGVNPYIAADTMLDRMVICYLKAGWHQRGATFFREQIHSADAKEPLLISLAIMERRAGQPAAAYKSLGKVLFSRTASKQARVKARQLKSFWQENDQAPMPETAS